MFAVKAGQAVMGHQQQVQGVNRRNREKLSQFDDANVEYQNEVTINNAKWKNDVLEAEVEQDQVFQAMVSQWNQEDQQLDQMYAQHDLALQDELVKMYENSYAGTMTGRTAGRLAGKSARQKGFAMAKQTADLILKQEASELRMEGKRMEAGSKITNLFNQIRQPPTHGHTPIPPELEAKPSSAALLLNVAGAAVQSFGVADATKAGDTGFKELPAQESGLNLAGVSQYNTSPDPFNITDYTAVENLDLSPTPRSLNTKDMSAYSLGTNLNI